jgi:hypothetical protein
MSNRMDRRDFLKATGGTVAIASVPTLNAAMQHAFAPGCKYFSPAQASLVESIAEQMIPADEHPGGKAAGVVYYIDGVLAGPYGKFFRTQYEEGLAAIDADSQKKFGHNFAAISSQNQASILQSYRRGVRAGKTVTSFLGCSGAM